MSTICTRCCGTGFLNFDQIPTDVFAKFDESADPDIIFRWINSTDKHDVELCDCCGSGAGYHWHGRRGEHYNKEDPPGPDGAYSYNGGLCECH